MCEVFSNALASSIYCAKREADYKQLSRDIKAALSKSKTTIENGSSHRVADLGYCRIHVVKHKFSDGHVSNEAFIADRKGNTRVFGRDITNAQVLSFILKSWW